MLNAQNTRSTLDRETLTLTFERVLAASREQVFEAWTKSEHVTQWWDPTGTPLSACTIDLRTGGAFRFENVGHGPPFQGTYLVIERPAKLVFEAMGAVGTVLIDGRGEQSRLTVTIRCGSPEHFEQFVKLGVDAGTNQTLDNLVAYVGKNAA